MPALNQAVVDLPKKPETQVWARLSGGARNGTVGDCDSCCGADSRWQAGAGANLKSDGQSGYRPGQQLSRGDFRGEGGFDGGAERQIRRAPAAGSSTG